MRRSTRTSSASWRSRVGPTAQSQTTTWPWRSRGHDRAPRSGGRRRPHGRAATTARLDRARVLSERILSTPLGGLLPQGVELSSLRAYHVGPGSLPGLATGSYVDVALKGDGHRDSVFFYVFDTARQAQAFDTDLAPGGYHTIESINSSGFSQQANCRALAIPHPHPRRAPTSQAVPSAGVTSSCTARQVLPRTPPRTRILLL